MLAQFAYPPIFPPQLSSWRARDDEHVILADWNVDYFVEHWGAVSPLSTFEVPSLLLTLMLKIFSAYFTAALPTRSINRFGALRQSTAVRCTLKKKPRPPGLGTGASSFVAGTAVTPGLFNQ